MAHRTPTKTVPISEARRRLFELVDDVVTGRADRVALSHRAHDDEVVLVRARELDKLEREVAELRARVEPEPFSLRGRIKLLVSPAEFEANMARERARQAELFDAKLASIFAAPEPDGADDEGSEPTVADGHA